MVPSPRQLAIVSYGKELWSYEQIRHHLSPQNFDPGTFLSLNLKKYTDSMPGAEPTQTEDGRFQNTIRAVYGTPAFGVIMKRLFHEIVSDERITAIAMFDHTKGVHFVNVVARTLESMLGFLRWNGDIPVFNSHHFPLCDCKNQSDMNVYIEAFKAWQLSPVACSSARKDQRYGREAVFWRRPQHAAHVGSSLERGDCCSRNYLVERKLGARDRFDGKSSTTSTSSEQTSSQQPPRASASS